MGALIGQKRQNPLDYPEQLFYYIAMQIITVGVSPCAYPGKRFKNEFYKNESNFRFGGRATDYCLLATDYFKKNLNKRLWSLKKVKNDNEPNFESDPRLRTTENTPKRGRFQGFQFVEWLGSASTRNDENILALEERCIKCHSEEQSDEESEPGVVRRILR